MTFIEGMTFIEQVGQFRPPFYVAKSRADTVIVAIILAYQTGRAEITVADAELAKAKVKESRGKGVELEEEEKVISAPKEEMEDYLATTLKRIFPEMVGKLDIAMDFTLDKEGNAIKMEVRTRLKVTVEEEEEDAASVDGEIGEETGEDTEEAKKREEIAEKMEEAAKLRDTPIEYLGQLFLFSSESKKLTLSFSYALGQTSRSRRGD
jgi:hypothetical protein